MSSYICMGVALREESAHDSVGGGQGGLVCSLGCWSIFRGFTHSASPLPIVLCCATPLTPAARLSFRLKRTLSKRGSAVCARLGTRTQLGLVEPLCCSAAVSVCLVWCSQRHHFVLSLSPRLRPLSWLTPASVSACCGASRRVIQARGVDNAEGGIVVGSCYKNICLYCGPLWRSR